MVFEREAVKREVELQRVAFLRGWLHHRGEVAQTYHDAERMVVGLYPLPPVKRPVRVTMSDRSVWSYMRIGGPGLTVLQNVPLFERFDAQCGSVLLLTEIGVHIRTEDDAKKLGRMLSGELEDAPEEENDG